MSVAYIIFRISRRVRRFLGTCPEKADMTGLQSSIFTFLKQYSSDSMIVCGQLSKLLLIIIYLRKANGVRKQLNDLKTHIYTLFPTRQTLENIRLAQYLGITISDNMDKCQHIS